MELGETNGLLNQVQGVITENPFASGLVGGAIAGATAGALVTSAVKNRKKRKSSKKKKAYSHKRKRRSNKQKRRYTPHTAGKRRDRSSKRIRHTKTGQPYIILKSGKARFIKKSSARRSRKLKGGRY